MMTNNIADDVRRTPLGNVDYVTRRPVFAVGQSVIGNHVVTSPRLHEVAAARPMRVAVAQFEPFRATNVDVVCPPTIVAIPRQLRKLDQYLVSPREPVACQHAVLVVMQKDVTQRKSLAHVADRCAVFVWRSCAGDLDVFDDHVVAHEQPNVAVLDSSAIRRDEGSNARTPHDNAILRPKRHVTSIYAGIDLHHIAVRCNTCRSGNRFELTFWADPQNPRG